MKYYNSAPIGMFVLDPEKRCTIAELRNHPWFIMEFTDLKNSIDSVEGTAFPPCI
jgi:hypothetical protein